MKHRCRASFVLAPVLLCPPGTLATRFIYVWGMPLPLCDNCYRTWALDRSKDLTRDIWDWKDITREEFEVMEVMEE